MPELIASTETLIIKSSVTAEPYQPTWAAMRQLTMERTENTPDELWLLEHQPVFTQGQAGKAEHILKTSAIPIIQTDRGGQVTYHGPGQLMIYPLLDLRRHQHHVKSLVCTLEAVIIDLLKQYDIPGERKTGAPGIYVHGAKIASIGLRIKKGACYHGISLNLNMDLLPFSFINPCGFNNLQMVNMNHWAPELTMASLKQQLISVLLRHFPYFKATMTQDFAVQ